MEVLCGGVDNRVFGAVGRGVDVGRSRIAKS